MASERGVLRKHRTQSQRAFRCPMPPASGLARGFGARPRSDPPGDGRLGPLSAGLGSECPRASSERRLSLASQLLTPPPGFTGAAAPLETGGLWRDCVAASSEHCPVPALLDWGCPACACPSEGCPGAVHSHSGEHGLRVPDRAHAPSGMATLGTSREPAAAASLVNTSLRPTGTAAEGVLVGGAAPAGSPEHAGWGDSSAGR